MSTPVEAAEVRYVVATALGAGNARNEGISAARGTVIAFCDDDVEADPGWLREVTGPVADGTWDAVAGRVELDWQEPQPRWLPTILHSYLAEYRPYPIESELGPGDFLLTANAAFRADLLRDIGGFDPVLGPRGGIPIVNDDVDLFRRFCAAGGRALYRPTALVLHELPAARLRRRYLIKRLYGQGRSDFLLERQALTRTTTRGLKAGVQQLIEDVRRDGGQQPAAAKLALLACDVARFAGFAREGLASVASPWPETRAPSP
jgi:glycosyltransferase involved in cell wall biosynthesis